jgi:hypothetical protein
MVGDSGAAVAKLHFGQKCPDFPGWHAQVDPLVSFDCLGRVNRVEGEMVLLECCCRQRRHRRLSSSVVEKSVAAVFWPSTVRPLDFKTPRLNCRVQNQSPPTRSHYSIGIIIIC